MPEITSRPFQPNPDVCCEACVFGRGQHSDWCEVFLQLMEERHMEGALSDASWD